MSFDGTKHDIQLKGVGYKIGGYAKSVQNDFVPRIGSGQQRETDFTTLRSKSLYSFEGGQLQREWQEDNAFYGSEGLYPIYDDGVLYPVNAPVSSSGLIGSNKAVQTAECRDQDYVFIASRTFNTPTNRIVRVDSSGTKTALTLPSSLSGAAYSITSMVIWNDSLWIATSTNGLWYCGLASTTVSEVTGGSGYFSQLVVYKGNLYGTSGNNENNSLFRYTGNTTTRDYVLVGYCGQRDRDYTASLFVYNNRIYLARKEGLWAYDGVSLVDVMRATDNIDSKNFRFPRELKGWLYYFMPDGMYRFNGATVEKLYDVNEIGFPEDVVVGKNRLWVLYKNSSVEGSTRFDRLMGYDYTSTNNVDGRVAVFNGRGMYTYARTSTFIKNPGTDDVADQGSVHKMSWFNDKLYITLYYEKTIGNEHFEIDTDEVNASGQKTWRLITSIYDGDFGMVDKSLEKYDLLLDGDVTSLAGSDTIEVSVRNDDFDQDGSWELLGDFLDSTDYEVFAHSAKPNGYSFNQIQTLYEGTTTAGYGIKQLTMRFLVVPELRWEWEITTLCYGDDTTEPLVLSDGSLETTGVRALRGNLYQAVVSKFPSLFVDIDFCELDTGGITNSDTTIPLVDASLLKEPTGFILIDNEIIRWNAKSGDQVTALERGALGTTAASHTAGTRVYLAYRVDVQMRNERQLMSPAGQVLDGKAYPSEITLLLREI